MISFTPLGKNVSVIKKYIEEFGGGFCDLTLGVKYMWRDDFVIEYAIIDDTLIMKENSQDYAGAFYYPIGLNVEGALLAIEEYTKKNNLPLTFCCLDNTQAATLSKRYHAVSVSNDRDWSDYIYEAEKFKTYSGKKNSGQRNHVNKFKKLYPDYKVKIIEKSDFPRIKEFLTEFNAKTEFLRWSEAIEQKLVFDLVYNMFELDQVGALIEVDGKVIAFSVGERIKNTLIVHVEKAFKNYDGIYPTMAQEFAKLFVTSEVKFINREEDCGDNGLRISKLQYHPIEVKEKNLVKVKTLFDNLLAPILIKTDRLEITPIYENDKERYCALYLDDSLNKWWGYDYREDLGDGEPTPEYFYRFQNSLKEKKEEYSLAVKIDGAMIGELVLHNFDYYGGVEIGFRFFKDYQNKGYAFESASAVKEYCVNVLGAKKIKSRCFKENAPSRRLIERLNLKLTKQDKTHYYFETNE